MVDVRVFGTWTAVLRSSLPKNANILPSTWAYKIKRLPDGEILKFKARFCVRGDRQVENQDVFETFAPVCQWSTVRTLLTFALQEKLYTQQVDFSNAFCQATLPPEEQVFIEIPKDFGWAGPDENVVLKLNKSLYGLRQAALHWFEKITSALESRDYVQSRDDPCMFIHESNGRHRFRHNTSNISWINTRFLARSRLCRCSSLHSHQK